MRNQRLRAWTNAVSALGVFAGALAFFVLTGPRGMAWLEGAEFQRRVLLAEIGEGPWDRPLFVLLSQPFLLLPWGSMARRASLGAAAFSAGACLFLYLLLKRLLAVAPQFVARRVGLLGALSLAAAHGFWLRTVTPGPETLDAFLLAVTLFCLFRFSNEGRLAYLDVAMVALGLSLANGLIALFLLPAFLIYLLWVKPPLVRDLKRARWRGLKMFFVGSAAALAIAAWGWSAAGFEIPPDRWSWLTFWQGHLHLTAEALRSSAGRFGLNLLYSFPPWTTIFAVIGWWQFRKRQRPFFWLLVAVFLIQAGATVGLALENPSGAYVVCWMLVALAAGYGWWARLSESGPYGFAWALALTAAPLGIYRWAPAVIDGVAEGVRVRAWLRPPFELPIDPLPYLLNPDRSGTPDARGHAQAALVALPERARVVAASPSGEALLSPLRLLAAEGNQPGVVFEPGVLSSDRAARWLAPGEPTLFLAGLHPPGAVTERLLESHHFLPQGHLYAVLPRTGVPGRTLADTGETVGLVGEWYGFERPQGYAVSFRIEETPEGGLGGRAVLNPGGARPLEATFQRLDFVSGSMGAQLSHTPRLDVHLKGEVAGNRLEGEWVVYQLPSLAGRFTLWKQ